MTMDIVYYNKKSLICEKEEKMKGLLKTIACALIIFAVIAMQ